MRRDLTEFAEKVFIHMFNYRKHFHVIVFLLITVVMDKIYCVKFATSFGKLCNSIKLSTICLANSKLVDP